MGKKNDRVSSEKKRKIWQPRVLAWQRSSLSQREYCQRHHLSSRQFSYWKNILASEPAASDVPHKFVPVPVQPAPEPSALQGNEAGLTVRLANGIGIELAISAKVQVVVHIRLKYACKGCEGLEDKGKSVKLSPVPAQIIPKGLATAGLLAHVLVGKFCDALPFYRQEKQFSRLGIDIPRQTMCNWAMKAAHACEDIMSLLHDEVRGGPLINADETTVQVLNEPGRSAQTKSYMWVFRGGSPDKPVVVYQYHPSRSAEVAKVFLRDYKGVVQTDGYAGYNFLDRWEDVLHVACWAHVRRKFYEAKKASASKKPGSADKALAMIGRLYQLERQAKMAGLDAEDLKKMRQQKGKPIVNDMGKWLEKRQSQIPPKSLLGKAINYSLNQWPRLIGYLENGFAGIDNNMAENAIRPFVIGRKNWLFSGTPKGARSSAALYSLIESAKACDLEPYAYLRYLFEKLPTTPRAARKELLPSALTAADLILPNVVSGV
jgi:transposase